MNLTDLAIQYKTSVVILTIVLAFAGLGSYITLPKESTPQIEIPLIVVTTVYPGVSPGDIETLVTQPIERETQVINGIKEIRSTSTEGVSTVIIEFEPQISIDDAFQKTRDKVDIAKADLPSDVEEPIVSEIDFSEFPIMSINLTGNYSLTKLKELGDDMADEIESVPGILGVDVLGGLEREVKVNVDLNLLKGYNLNFNDIINTIRGENTTIPGGSIDVDRSNYLVRVSGEIDDPRQLENFIVKVPEGLPGETVKPPIYLRDIADVEFGYKERASYSRLTIVKREDAEGIYQPLPDDQIRETDVVTLNVKKRSGENILVAVDGVKEVLDTFPVPEGTLIEITGDTSVEVRTLVSDLENNIISGMFFIILVLLFFLGIRNATLVGMAIPLSMFISFIILQVLGYTMNFIVLFSLIIALGMLVDNAIVIIENIYRFREEGHSNFEAARLATKEVSGAVIASTATTVAAFSPMLFWPGIIGEFMGYLPLTLIITLISSLFVALIINPVLTGIFIRLDGEEAPERSVWSKRISIIATVLVLAMIGLANPITLVVLVVGGGSFYLIHKHLLKPVGDRFVKTGLPRLTGSYKGFLGWMLERDYNVKRPFLRNTFALSVFTVGIIFLIVSAIVSGSLGERSAMITQYPGMALAAIGAIGILIHTMEAFFVGKMGSVRLGLVILAVFGATLLFQVFTGKDIGLEVIGALMLVPFLSIILGLLGKFFLKKDTLILTDNRAKLMNASIGMIFFIGLVFAIAPTGVEFFPPSDPNQIALEIDADLGTNIGTSNRMANTAKNRIDRWLQDQPASKGNVKNVLVQVGVGGDIFFGGGAAGPERAKVTMNMVDFAERDERSSDTIARLREEIGGFPGAEIEISQDSQGPPTGAPVNIEITGEDFETIVEISEYIENTLQQASLSGSIPGLVDIKSNLNSGRPEMKVNIDREKVALFGLTTSQVASTIRTAINGTEASKFRDGEDEYDITVRLNEVDRGDLESLKNMTIAHDGNQVPLVSLADFETGTGLGSVTRLDLQRVVTIRGGVAPGFQAPQVLALVQGELEDYEANLPSGYSLSYTGENEEMDESFAFLTRALLIGLALIFMIMIAQFNKISAPFIIMVAVGLSLLGVLLGLIMTRTSFGLMTFIGVISLAGIVVNNSIVLVDYILQLQERGLSKTQAILEGGATRLRPVLLTALTTILGLIPLTFGLNIDFIGLITELNPDFAIGSANTQFWGPMGIAIISGLSFATFLTLVIVPVMYSLFDSLARKLGEVMKPSSANSEIDFIQASGK